MNNSLFVNNKNYVDAKYVSVSICKSNIKHKEKTYYARVCKTGKVNQQALLSLLKEKAPYIDIDMLKLGLEKMQKLIVELASSGKTVDFLGLGSFSLQTKGKVKIMEGMHHCVDDNIDMISEFADCNIEKKNANFDVSQSLISEPKFNLKFTPSAVCKKMIEKVKMKVAIKKRRSPLIESIEDATPNNCLNDMSMIKVRGHNLKVLGEKDEVGIYIKEKNSTVIFCIPF